ncbi:hypothetical protein WR25_02389 isoform A [Diploscapter pachys]|uniref:Uncharacterized protein n=2 Tax=Diploscapter pachys TaxID=2018661 RepID=A0A2A2LLT6_9BILA|nr:hypothetical protein WR25_02389 isoform A [Diploscapter pachys]
MFAAYATSGPSGSGGGSIKKEPEQADQTEQKGLNEQITGKYSSFVGAAVSQNAEKFRGTKKIIADLPDENDAAAGTQKGHVDVQPSSSKELKREPPSGSSDESGDSEAEPDVKRRSERHGKFGSDDDRERSKKKDRKHKKKKHKKKEKKRKRERSSSREPEKKRKRKLEAEKSTNTRSFPQERWVFYNSRYKDSVFVYHLAADHFNFTADGVSSSQRSKYNIRYAIVLMGNAKLNKCFYPQQAAKAERKELRFYRTCAHLPVPTETVFRSHPTKELTAFVAISGTPFDPRSEEELQDESKARTEVEQLMAGDKDGEEKEEFESKFSFEVRRRAKILATTRDPTNMNAWLERLKIEDEFYKRQVESGDKNYLQSTHNEIKLDILKHAIQKCPREVRLRLLKIEMLAENGTHADVIKEYKALIHTFPANVSAWTEYLDYVQFNKGAYSEARMNQVFKECFERVQPIVDRLRRGEHRFGEEKLNVDELHKFLLDTFVRKLRWLCETGKGHLATASLQATIEFNLNEPIWDKSQKVNQQMKIEDFKEYWMKKFPRIGDHGAIGWRKWYNLKSEAKIVVTSEDLESYENGQEEEELNKMKKWINKSEEPDEVCLIELERLLDRINLRSRRNEREETGDNEDDFFVKPVPFEGLHVFSVSSNRTFEDVIYCLKAFGASLPQENHDLSSTFEALKLLHLDSAFYRNSAGLKLVRQICLFLAENEADTKRLMTIRYIYAINELRLQLWSSKSGFDPEKSLRIFKKTIAQMQSEMAEFKKKSDKLANLCAIAEMLVVFRALREYFCKSDLDDDLRRFAAAGFANFIFSKKDPLFGMQLKLAALLEFIKLQTSAQDIRNHLAAYVLGKKPEEIALLDYPRALVAWEEMKQGFMMDNAKQIDFIESPLALVVALQNIFVYYQDDKEDKRPLLSVKKNEEAEGEDQHQRHLQSGDPGNWPEEKINENMELVEIMKTEADRKLITETYLMLLETYSESNGSFKKKLVDELSRYLKANPTSPRLLSAYIDLVLHSGGAKALSLKMKLQQLKQLSRQEKELHERNVDLTYALANIYLERRKLERLRKAGVSQSTLDRRQYEVIREEARRVRDAVIWRLALQEAPENKREEAYILASSQIIWCRDLHLDYVALTANINTMTKTWSLMTEAGVPYYTDTDVIEIYKQMKM